MKEGEKEGRREGNQEKVRKMAKGRERREGETGRRIVTGWQVHQIFKPQSVNG